ncbi:MAG: zinc ribbon domain-containing protein [Pseudobutyrivibrio sp.]|nr:zinc ribbon domain-containing protein [Pseudobutyrivibrio sp.]
MFFIMGITDGRKDFDFTQTVICDNCGKYGRYQVFVLYTVLSLFFIPTFKWNKRYYVQMSCCGTVYELDSEIGKRIASGEDLQIKPEDLNKVSQGRGFVKRCNNCGYETSEDFDFCPKCGTRF